MNFTTLNIISESYSRHILGGPRKVIINTLKGLDKINYPYVLNKDITNYKYNWIHDSARGLIEVSVYEIPSVIGPNIAVMPNDLPRVSPTFKNCTYLHPSSWCVDVWKKIGFNDCILAAWPAGIDAEEFPTRILTSQRKNVMIYFKRRDPALLVMALRIVRKAGFDPLIVKYGEYNEDQYRRILSLCQFGIWIGISESQGIGLQEALASDLPLIVCDVNSLFESSDPNDYRFPETLRDFKPTSAPYFDGRCGIIINDFTKLEKSVDEMLSNLIRYRPRDYIIENLSLEKQAKELLSFFDTLEPRIQDYLSNKRIGNNIESFKISIKAKISFMIFVFLRKIKTMSRISSRLLIMAFHKRYYRNNCFGL